MDAFLFKLLGAAGWGWENKEWLTLVGIFYASVKLQHGMKLQKTECSGSFNLINQKITTVEKIVEKADTKSTEAIDAVKAMKPKLDEVHKGFIEFIDNKYDKKVAQNGKKESTQ